MFKSLAARVSVMPAARLLAGALLVLAAGLGGCSTLAPAIETPRLSIAGLAMPSTDLFSQQFLVRLNVENPNDRQLTVKAIEYQLFLEGDSFAQGSTSNAFVVPALGSTEFDMMVRTNFISSAGRLLTRLNGREQVNYVLEGTVHADLGLIRKIPFRRSGSVTLQGLR